MSTKSNHHAAPCHADIARLAYQFYEQAGRPQGRDLEFWFRAERACSCTEVAPLPSWTNTPRTTQTEPRRKRVAVQAM